MILESAPGQFVELPEDIFKSIWKRGVNSFSAPLDTSVTRKERMAGIGQILSPLCTAWCVYLSWLCIPLFKANTERQCTIWDFINFWRSILLQLLFCSKVKATLTSWKCSEGDEQGAHHHWTLPTCPGNVCMPLSSENMSMILSLFQYLVPVQVASGFVSIV